MKLSELFKKQNDPVKAAPKKASNLVVRAKKEETEKEPLLPFQNAAQGKAAADNKEAVDETIKELKAEKAGEKKKRPLYLTVLFFVFFPITLFTMLVIYITKKIKIPISVKMLITFSVMFVLLLVLFAFFLTDSFKNQLQETAENAAYLDKLKVTTVILITVFSIVFMALVTVGSTLILSPIRRMKERIDDITTENLSARLEIIDSQDELMELRDCINGLLDDIEELFVRQQNFVSDASHELKTPIAVIQGYSNMLKRWGKDDPAILTEGIDSIQRESENMKRIVDQLLILARIGKMNQTRTEFDLGEALNTIVEGYRVVHNTHSIAINVQDDVILFTDKNLLLESVRTLVDNAFKYTPVGGTVRISCERDDNCAKIIVEDNGMGISKEDLPKIFDRFFRCDKARGREKGSSGLGLTIAKSIVETLGGTIYAESELSKGSKFTIELY